ncbi:uncharacterized protein RMCC_5787 [Mycolicibacterium canariasense]|uniref:Uncharacterized protein n=1 Tax=Mycolicibacterium canariasense TaxID=228230 RepID=A0A117IC31_MYCCR|nr:hypothetical protein [Mycolicibacterium canariasense]MCV7210174.1 hypothetical protein [Mycolicibacterium canariasense]ORU97877.1 hypothetical protein AWB94_29440 [Mycolicibacterium canariasense]GAS98822.1 uncharacterized protein RMCC_5787 [Mycolicibacterium canariasense]
MLKTTLAAGILIGAAIGVPIGPAIITAHAAPTIQEDDPDWDCRVDGDRVCGPTNTQGVATGLYRDGQLAVKWDQAWYGHPELVPVN